MEAEDDVDLRDLENKNSGEGCSTNDMIPDLRVGGFILASVIQQVLEILGTETCYRPVLPFLLQPYPQ